MSEQSAVQNPLVKYVSEKEIGWKYVDRDKAVELRRGETGLFFYDLLKEQIVRLNPGIVDETKADSIIKDLENVRSSIEGNSDVLRYLKGEKYNGPQNLDSVISYTWEIKGGGPSGTNAKEVSAFI